MSELDLLGVGFGPSNLALALAVDETPVRAVFCERQPRFGWHRGMLLPGSTMQVAFLKDLVTLRNPTSPASFVCYLHEQGRLVDFINHATFTPSRVEFHDYLEWAAARVRSEVRYGVTVEALHPVHGPDRVDGEREIGAFRAQLSDGTSVQARSVTLGTGLRPRLPHGLTISDTVWHNQDLLLRLADLDAAVAAGERPAPRRFVVLGAGQSAAEVTRHLHAGYPHAEVDVVFAGFGFTPADDSPFANRVFDPESVDEFHAAPDPVREDLVRRHRSTNYGVVDLSLIEELYAIEYGERVSGRRRLRVRRASEVLDVEDRGTSVRVEVGERTTGVVTPVEADVLVCATGFDQLDPTTLLGDLAALVRRDDRGRARVHRDYRLDLPEHVTAAVHLLGGTEHSHGLSASLLSNTAVRAGDVLAAIRTRSPARRQPGPVNLHPVTLDDHLTSWTAIP